MLVKEEGEPGYQQVLVTWNYRNTEVKEKSKETFSDLVSPHTISSFPMNDEIVQQVLTELLLGTKHFAECFEDVKNKKIEFFSPALYTLVQEMRQHFVTKFHAM